MPDTCLINVSIRLTSRPLLLHLQMSHHENGIESEAWKVLGVQYMLTMGIGLPHTTGSELMLLPLMTVPEGRDSVTLTVAPSQATQHFGNQPRPDAEAQTPHLRREGIERYPCLVCNPNSPQSSCRQFCFSGLSRDSPSCLHGQCHSQVSPGCVSQNALHLQVPQAWVSNTHIWSFNHSTFIEYLLYA